MGDKNEMLQMGVLEGRGGGWVRPAVGTKEGTCCAERGCYT